MVWNSQNSAVAPPDGNTCCLESLDNMRSEARLRAMDNAQVASLAEYTLRGGCAAVRVGCMTREYVASVDSTLFAM